MRHSHTAGYVALPHVSSCLKGAGGGSAYEVPSGAGGGVCLRGARWKSSEPERRLQVRVLLAEAEVSTVGGKPGFEPNEHQCTKGALQGDSAWARVPLPSRFSAT